MADLEELIERVESGTGADRGIDAQVWLSVVEKPRRGDKIDKDMIGRWPEYTTSLDAVLALIEAKLPGAYRSLEMGISGKGNLAEVAIEAPGDERAAYSGEATSPARALLAATLKALKETQHADR